MSVFISYRRDGGRVVAEKIYEELSVRYNIFLDTESLKNGRFDKAIEDQIKECIDFIVIVTPTTFDRCIAPDDWILNEGRIALQQEKNIIPVFIGIDTFPPNVPLPLKELCNYNGILWKDENSINTIESFLLSNRKYILSITNDGNRPILTEFSCEQLKNLFQRCTKYGRVPVDIDLKIDEPEIMAKSFIRQDIEESYGHDFALQYAEQSILKRFQWYKKTFIFAIEHLLEDEMLDSCATRARQYYTERYGTNNCYYLDQDGVEHFYWTAFLWIDVIEEMLKEITLEMGRDYYYANTRRDKYREVDLFVMTRSGEEIWHFTSFIEIDPDNEKYAELARLFKSYSWGDFMHIPVKDLVYRVYPDLYFAIGSLKADSDQTEFQRLCRYKGIFNLMHYYIGVH